MFLLGQLSSLIRDEYSLLGGLREDAEDIRNALDRLTAALRVADEMEEIDPQVQAWVRIVRELAYDTEDVLDEFLFLFGGRRTGDGFYTKIKNIYTSVKNLRARRRLALALRRIKAKVNENSQYQPSLPTTFLGTLHHAHNKRMYDSRGDARLVEESDLVGIHYPKQFLVNLLLANDEELKVHSVVGMGGLGKTTLVKQAYDDVKVKNHFQYRVWVTVSETLEIKELLKDAIKQFVEQTKQDLPRDFEAMDTIRLKEFVKHILSGRRYIIVLDDIWDINAWMEIKCVFPKQAFGSRVVITTRNSEIGAHACHDTGGVVCSLKHLSPKDSWTLFCRKTFLCDSCPQHLVSITTNILKRCCGLPLAIVVIAGVLATKNKGIEEWERFQQSLNIQLVEGNDMMKNMKNLLSLSYYDLPYYLKYCFVYMCIFPEDFIIPKMQLIRLWIAEGFVRENNQQVKEEVAEAYLDELLHRNLIQLQIGWKAAFIKTRGFRVHDILREIVLSKSVEQNFATIANRRNIESPKMFRRLAIHRFDDQILKSTSSRKNLRSLLIIESLSSLNVSLLLSKFFTGSYSPLKVLELRGAQLEEIPEQVFNLFQLKYLSLSNTKLRSVPKSIGRLQNLETLDLRYTCVNELPAEVSKLCKLRHLLCYSNSLVRFYPWSVDEIPSFNAQFKVGELLFLQELCRIQANDTTRGKVVSEIGKLTQLRRLGITKLRQEDGIELCSSLKKLTNLYSLDLSLVSGDEVLDITLDLPLRLSQLKLIGRLERAPQCLSSLVGLTSLFLAWSKLSEDPLLLLQDLPMLTKLVLVKSYEGEGLCFKAEKFSKLKLLAIAGFAALKWITMEGGSLRHLERFALQKCESLVQLPLGIEYLSNLKALHFDELLDITFEPNCKNYAKISHIPIIYTSKLIDDQRKNLFELPSFLSVPMAHAPVMFLLGQLSSLICDEYSLLGGLREDAEHIRNALDRLTAALRVADEMEEIDPQVQAWVRIVRELAYDTQDVLDEFMFRFGGGRTGDGFYTKIKNIYTSVKNLRARRRLALALRRIKAKVNENLQYQPSLPTTFPGTVHHVHNNRMYDSRGDACLVEESDLVGIHYPKQFLVNLLLANDEELKVHSVVGTGGLGKTTLVRQAYDDAEVKNLFQYRVWVTVSEKFEIDELLKDAIKQFMEQTKQGLPQDFEAMSSTRLKEFVKEILSGRRYIIVFDDIWGINAWMEIKCVLSKEAFGSRVVITTRNSEIGAQACHDTRGVVYSLKYLSREDSWTLFCKKTFLCDSCPQHLVNITTNILNRCSGLPLAIVVIAGVLATKNEDIEEWERFQQSLNIQLVEGNDMMKNMKNLLSLSYYDLPYYLKYCFLYMCIFPEDFLIPKMQLIRLWIAEGFVRENNQQVKEEVAEAYLDELLHRNLIQLWEIIVDKIMGFRVHDILREIVLSKSVEQSFATIANRRNIESSIQIRRLVIHRFDEQILKSTTSKKHLRSLLIIESLSSLNVSLLLSKFFTGSYSPLKVLELRGAQLEEIPEQVFNLFQFKYLSLRNTKLRSVPKSIGRLQNLETLDLKYTLVNELPAEVSKLYLCLASEDEILDITLDLHRRLRKLKLIGRLERAPQCLSSLVGLTTLLLGWSKLSEDPLLLLQDLPMLTNLSLVMSCEGEGLCFKAEKFSKLKFLGIVGFAALKWITMEEGSLHHLEMFIMYKCELFEQVPLGIEYLSNLKTLYFDELPDITFEPNCKNYAKISHIPSIFTSKLIDGKLTDFLNGQKL
nr:disease resistance protein RPM1-like [Ipomoea batatas]